MFYVLLVAMILGWYEGNRELFRVHNGIDSGVKPSNNLLEFLINP